MGWRATAGAFPCQQLFKMTGESFASRKRFNRVVFVLLRFSARFWLGLCRRRLVAALVLLLLGCGRSYLPVLGSVRRGLCFFRWVSVALFGGVPRCAVLRSNGWVSAPHGRRCVSVVLAWRRKVKQAKAFSGGLRFSVRCCPSGASSLIVK